MGEMRSLVRSRLLLLLAAWVLCAATDAASQTAPGDRIVWAGSFEAGLEEARIEGRIVMIDFYTSWCGWCRRLDTDTYAHPEVVRRSRRMVCVKVNAEIERELAARYSVRAFPTIVFVRGDGGLIDAVRGYKPPEQFVPILDQHLDSRGAEFTLSQRLKDHPELVDVRYDLAQLHLRNGEADRALAQLDTLEGAPGAMSDEQVWNVRLDRGRALHMAGRHKEAAKELESFAKKQKKSPRHAEAVFFLAEAKRAQGDTKDARKWYRKLLEANSSGWLAERSRERLQELG